MIKKLPITIIIMASGFSKRMGEDKLSLQVDGKTLLSYCLYGAKNTLAKEKILITKNQFSSKNFKNIINNNSKLGQSHSIKLGILNSSIYKEEINQGGFMFLPADMPLLTSKHLDDLMFFLQKTHQR